MNAYPHFAVPHELAVKSVPLWTEAEAKRYLVWLTSSIESRVAGLLSFLGENDEEDRPLIDRVGRKASWVLRKRGNTTGASDAGLSESGYALAADVGLLVAQRLCRQLPHLRWEVVRKPKHDASYNQPVLRGFGAMHFDPVRGSVAEALRAIREPTVGNPWIAMYEYWLERGAAHSDHRSVHLPNP